MFLNIPLIDTNPILLGDSSELKKQSPRRVLRSCAACNFIKKETLAQVFSCEVCEISKNNFFHRTPLVAASRIKNDRANDKNIGMNTGINQ